MKLSKLAIIILLIAATTVFSGCGKIKPAIKRNANGNSNVNENVNQNININKNTNATPNEWKTYENKDWGIAFSYPEDWELSDSKIEGYSDISVRLTKKLDNKYEYGINIHNFIYSKNKPIEKQLDQMKCGTEPFEIGCEELKNKNGVKYIRLIGLIRRSNMGWTELRADIPTGKEVLSFRQNIWIKGKKQTTGHEEISQKFPDLIKTFDQILETVELR